MAFGWQQIQNTLLRMYIYIYYWSVEKTVVWIYRLYLYMSRFRQQRLFAWNMLESKDTCTCISEKCNYCGIIIVRGGLMFVDFVGHSYRRIYIPTNLYFCYLSFSKHCPNCIIHKLPPKLYPHEQDKCCLPTDIDPPRIKVIPQYFPLQDL
jgi:hypothetical protein